MMKNRRKFVDTPKEGACKSESRLRTFCLMALVIIVSASYYFFTH